MRTKTNFLFKTTVLFVLIIGTIGCRSNGNGPWYDVRSYSLYNPLRPENHSRADSTSVATDNSRKPHLDSKIDVRQPDGGYYEQQQRNVAAINHNSDSAAINGGMISTSYPIHHTGYHSEQPTTSIAPTTPQPYSAATAAPSYGSGAPSYGSGASAASPINPVAYAAPAYGQPTDYYAAPQPPQQTEVKNDMPPMSNPYTVPSGSHQGYPITTTYPADNNYQPNTYDTSRSNAGGVASPFANPTGQPTATGTIPPNPNSGYGALPANPVVTEASSYAGTSYGGTQVNMGTPYQSTQPTATINPNEQPNTGTTYGTNGITTSSGSIYTNPSTLK